MLHWIPKENAIRSYNILSHFYKTCFFKAYRAAIQLNDYRSQYSELIIPIAVIPATISNNVPGTDFSLGSDTAVNEITEVKY